MPEGVIHAEGGAHAMRVNQAWLAAERPARNETTEAARATALGNRLLDVEQQTMGLRAEIARMEQELASFVGGGGGGGGWFDVPARLHPWPLADRRGQEGPDLAKYDLRSDDPVIIEGRLGEAFLAAAALESAEPNFEAALAALNAMPRSLGLSWLASQPAPDVSIVIPIYGQLAYTLNCLDSLFSHQSVYTAEIIIIDDRSPDSSGAILPRVAGIRTHLQPQNGGFIRSCNTGGQMARGRYVIMLNNDTRVVPGWLDAMIDSFALFPRAGVVGSKLFYADGSLQEAGGIIWRDGSCWNYGRNNDPNRPNYAHARQVDYISGCSIALPTDLWRSLGGFDPYFTPAYCEDADLCLRVSALGHEVWLQPQSRIVHYEGKTGGTDTGKGVKAYQVVNNRKLYLRWRDRLERHRPNAEAPYFERERTVQRRALIVDVSMPTPKQDAGSVQTVLGLRVFQDLGYKTYFVPQDNWLFHPEYTAALHKMGVECAYAPYDLGFTQYMSTYGHLFDVVLVYRVGVMEQVIDDIRRFAPFACLLFHVADLHFLRQQREAELEGCADKLAGAEAVRVRELDIIGRSDCTITHSVVERDILAEAVPDAPVAVWPLMFDFFGTSVPYLARRDICFLGGYAHPPNVDAVRYFVDQILPLIRAADPSIGLLIAGANPTQAVRDLAGEGIEVLGMVDDLRDLFDRARVFVCPLRIGAGVKGKIMSALAYGLPIVSSSIGVEGSGLVADRHALVADRPEEFAAATLRLYGDEALWNRLSTDGQDLLRQSFSTEAGAQVLAGAIARGHAQRLGLGAAA